ncbi:MAG: adenosylcobinamide-GDP ribazoletransferase [Synergistetes bacterium]|nr:adenosylcobinamide-GDP ribazoletransferase [Synergistota bacterium]MCX8127222.1 adenosylcobinamide-GDP ribazoletransferase [Synergistota bacterium]MDW8191892.1 adenosylcobinamide-GDP ribazoletransferase [Synergistota bacterium]
MKVTVKAYLMKLIEEIIFAFSFLSRLPIKTDHFENSLNILKNISSYFTLIGYIPGLIYSLTAVFQSEIAIRIAGLALGFYLFDLFHFDGLLDMLDGFLNQSTREKRLEIMSRGNVGPFAVFYGTLYVIALYTTFSTLNPIDYMYASVLGRYAMTILIHISKPAKKEGLAASLFPQRRSSLFLALLFSTPLILSPQRFTLSLSISILLAFIIKRISEIKINGITGDVLGGTCLISQLTILLSLSILY